MENSNNEKEKVSKSFIWFWASSLNGGEMLIAATIGTYISVYLTDSLKMAAGVAAVVMLLSSLCDMFLDPLIGTLADRTNTKVGRYRPYFIIPPILITVVAVLLFVNPPFSMQVKIVYIAVLYILFNVLQTVLTMPNMAILPAVTKDNALRNKAISLSAIFTAAAFTIGSSATPTFLKYTGGSYVPLMVIYGILTIVLFWGLFATAKERYVTKTEKRPIFHDIKRLFRYKEVYPLMLTWLAISLGYGLMFASSVYYVMYYLARPDLITGYMLVISVGAFVSMALLMPIMLKVFKSGHKTLLISQALTFICYGICFVFGKNLIVLYVISFIATALGAMSNALSNVLVNDMIDFIQWKEGVVLNGTISALKGFAQKFGNTFTNSGILAVLAWTGYQAGAVGKEPVSALIGLNLVRFGIPALLCIIIVICMKFYPIAKHYGEIEEMKKNMKAVDEE